MIGVYNGSVADGQKAMKPLRDKLPAPIIDWMGEMPFTAMQTLFDGLMPKGLQWYWKGDYVGELSGKGDRRAHRQYEEGPGLAHAHAPLSDRRGGAPRARGRNAMERAERQVLHGDPRHDRRRPQARPAP
ncbi:MAG: hypothetical protein U1E87_04690 [Alphaproteobacteria bacterium]